MVDMANNSNKRKASHFQNIFVRIYKHKTQTALKSAILTRTLYLYEQILDLQLDGHARPPVVRVACLHRCVFKLGATLPIGLVHRYTLTLSCNHQEKWQLTILHWNDGNIPSMFL